MNARSGNSDAFLKPGHRRRLFKLSLASFLLVALIIAGVVLLVPPALKLEIVGDIPQEDVKAIQKTVDRYYRDYLLPNNSWESLKNFPRRVYEQRRMHIVKIEAPSEHRMTKDRIGELQPLEQVTVTFKYGQSNSSIPFVKMSNQWFPLIH